jgi:hypothetical protein
MPRQPIGTTFVVSMSVLGLIAAVQVLAVLLRYADVASQMLKERATHAEVAPQTPADPQATPFRPVQPTAPVNGKQIEQLLAEAGRAYRLGDFDSALKTIGQLETVAPGDPQVLLVKAAVLEKLDQPAEAVLLLEQVMKISGLPAESRVAVQKKIDALSQSLGTSGSPSKNGMTTKDFPEESGQTLRESTGIRPGATLGIIDIRVKDLKRGKKTLSVSVKSMPNVDISGDKVKILAYFYEKTDDGEVVLTDSRIDNQWMSPPIDWAESEPEILDLEYTLPESSGAEGRTYLGYVVGLYYNGELQDFRSVPGSLGKTHPLPLDDPQ